jgi:TolA-binding protein
MRIVMRIVLVGAILACVATPAFAQMESREAIALQNQILELRQELQMLAAQMQRGGGMPAPAPYAYQQAPAANGGNPDLMAQLLDRVSRLEDQVRNLSGRVDELQNAVQTQNADLTKQIGDLRFQMQNGGVPPAVPEAGPGVASGAASGLTPAAAAPPMPLLPQHPGTLGTMPQQGSAGAPPSAARRTPQLAMQQGNAALARRDYATAAASAREVLATNPRDYNAQFLLGEALAGQRDYQRAAIAYDDTFNRSPKGEHAQEALLGLANSLIGLNDKQAACGALEKLRLEFPSPQPDLRRPIADTRARAGCR